MIYPNACHEPRYPPRRGLGVRTDLKGADLPEASDVGRESPYVVWEVGQIAAEDILPSRPEHHRIRRRMRALRAMDRLGLIGEEYLIPALAARPELRWLVDEQGARWDVLAELGRIGRGGAFEEAVEWTLGTHPRPDEARAHILGVRSRTVVPDPVACEKGAPSMSPNPPPRTAEEEEIL
jgi:hypothetical protein